MAGLGGEGGGDLLGRLGEVGGDGHLGLGRQRGASDQQQHEPGEGRGQSAADGSEHGGLSAWNGHQKAYWVRMDTAL